MWHFEVETNPVINFNKDIFASSTEKDLALNNLNENSQISNGCPLRHDTMIAIQKHIYSFQAHLGNLDTFQSNPLEFSTLEYKFDTFTPLSYSKSLEIVSNSNLEDCEAPINLLTVKDSSLFSPEVIPYHEVNSLESIDSSKGESKGGQGCCNLDAAKSIIDGKHCLNGSLRNACSIIKLVSCSLEIDEISLKDKRRQKRMMDNRESARRSRLRKQQQLDDLRLQVEELKRENAEMVEKFGIASQNLALLSEKNYELRLHALELGHRLQRLHLAFRAQGMADSPWLELDMTYLDSFLTTLESSFRIPHTALPSCHSNPPQ